MISPQLNSLPTIRTTKQEAEPGGRRLGAQPPHCGHLLYDFGPFTESDPQPAAFVSSPIKQRRRLTKDLGSSQEQGALGTLEEEAAGCVPRPARPWVADGFPQPAREQSSRYSEKAGGWERI